MQKQIFSLNYILPTLALVGLNLLSARAATIKASDQIMALNGLNASQKLVFDKLLRQALEETKANPLDLINLGLKAHREREFLKASSPTSPPKTDQELPGSLLKEIQDAIKSLDKESVDMRQTSVRDEILDSQKPGDLDEIESSAQKEVEDISKEIEPTVNSESSVKTPHKVVTSDLEVVAPSTTTSPEKPVQEIIDAKPEQQTQTEVESDFESDETGADGFDDLNIRPVGPEVVEQVHEDSGCSKKEPSRKNHTTSRLNPRVKGHGDQEVETLTITSESKGTTPVIMSSSDPSSRVRADHNADEINHHPRVYRLPPAMMMPSMLHPMWGSFWTPSDYNHRVMVPHTAYFGLHSPFHYVATPTLRTKDQKSTQIASN